MHVSITILVDNNVIGPRVKSEHGFSIFIEADGRAMLFDTGQSDILIHNARALGIDLTRTEAIVLSHGHYDHVGGLLPVLEIIPGPCPVYAHPDIFVERYSHSTGKPRKAGSKFTVEELDLAGATLKLSKESREIFTGVYTTGEIPRVTDFEDVGGKFYLDPEGTIPDVIRDDQSLVIDAQRRLILLCGCCHSGLVNTMLHVHELFPDKRIDTVIGGLHLKNASKERMDTTIENLREFGVTMVMGGHCTGKRQAQRLAESVEVEAPPCNAGLRLEFG